MQVQHSLVWVWPNAGPNAHLKAMSKPAPVMPELLDEQNLLHVSPWYALLHIPTEHRSQLYNRCSHQSLATVILNYNCK